MSGLVLKNINKTFPGDQQAIRDFNLEVKDREFLILVGPTACGKSTLLRMIGGLEEITSGSLMIDGMDMTDADPKREKRRNAFQEQRALSWNECGGQPYILPQNGKDAGCRDREKSG